MHLYQAFQLNIRSELPFIELSTISPSAINAPDVTIKYGGVSLNGLDAPIKKGAFFQAQENVLWLHVPNIARFLVTDGCQITIDPLPGSDENSLRIFLLGSCMGALLMQRGLFLLHGNAVQIGSHAISFTGLSGAGKSTLSGAFYQRGYPILADDVCAINIHGEVIPSFPQIKLWADAAKQLSMDINAYRKIRPHIEKYAIPLGSSFYPERSPLRLVYILDSHNKDEMDMKNFSGVEKFQPLRLQTYRLHYVKGLRKEREHMAQCGQLAGRIDLARITRPNNGFHLEKLVDYVESDLAHRGLGRG